MEFLFKLLMSYSEQRRKKLNWYLLIDFIIPVRAHIENNKTISNYETAKTAHSL